MIPVILSQLRGVILHRAAASVCFRQHSACGPLSMDKRFAASSSSPLKDPAAVRKQVEYYFSDQNLKNDVYLHKKLSDAQDGWFPMAELLKFNKLKAMKVSASEIIDALKDSPLVKLRQVQQ